MSELALKYNDSPVCPYCSHEEGDAWELSLDNDGDSTEIECGECGEGYGISINVSCTYNTYKMEEAK